MENSRRSMEKRPGKRFRRAIGRGCALPAEGPAGQGRLPPDQDGVCRGERQGNCDDRPVRAKAVAGPLAGGWAQRFYNATWEPFMPQCSGSGTMIMADGNKLTPLDYAAPAGDAVPAKCRGWGCALAFVVFMAAALAGVGSDLVRIPVAKKAVLSAAMLVVFALLTHGLPGGSRGYRVLYALWVFFTLLQACSMWFWN